MWDSIKVVIDYILNNLGSHIFLPLVMLAIGLVVRLRFSKAFSAALTLGVAFLGMGVVLGFMFDAIGPASTAFVENTGLQLTAIDLGWTPTAAIAWAWSYAFLMFPLQIAINLIMLGFGWTNCLNVDLWNVWNKVLTGVLVAGVTGSVPLAFIAAAIQVVLELKNADLTQRQVYNITGIPGIALPHSMALSNVILAPMNRLLDFVPGINKVKLSPDTLKDKLGPFGENHVLGFIVGCLIGIFGTLDFSNFFAAETWATLGSSVPDILTLGVKAGTALTLFPMAASLFMQALAPIASAAGEFMKSRFPGREFYIGLDWPFLAGHPTLWVTSILLVPVILILAVVLPGNNVLPFGGLIHICFAATALVATQGDLFRSLILGIITTPVWLYVGTYFAPVITDLARQVGTITIPDNVTYITWGTMEMPEFRYAFAQIANIFTGNIFPGIIILPALAALYWYYVKLMKQKEAALAAQDEAA